HLLRRVGHLRYQRYLGVVRIAEQAGELTAQLDDPRDERRVVPVGLAELGGTRHAFAVHRLAQLAVVGVLHDRHVGRRVQGERVAALAFLLRRLAGRVYRVLRQAADAALVDRDGEGFGRIEQVLGEFACGAREFLLDDRIARLF